MIHSFWTRLWKPTLVLQWGSIITCTREERRQQRSEAFSSGRGPSTSTKRQKSVKLLKAAQSVCSCTVYGRVPQTKVRLLTDSQALLSWRRGPGGNRAVFSDWETSCFWPVSYRFQPTLALSMDVLTECMKRGMPSPLSARGHPGVPHEGRAIPMTAACWASQTYFKPLPAAVSKQKSSLDPLFPGSAASQSHLGAPFLHSLCSGGSMVSLDSLIPSSTALSVSIWEHGGACFPLSSLEEKLSSVYYHMPTLRAHRTRPVRQKFRSYTCLAFRTHSK